LKGEVACDQEGHKKDNQQKNAPAGPALSHD
jgi:hypothetical protein